MDEQVQDAILPQNDPDVLIDVQHASMVYRTLPMRVDNIKEYVIRLFKGQLHYEKFCAVNDVTLQVRRGDGLGLIGPNGAGKSTLLRMIAGILEPTSGSIRTYGTMVPLLRLGAGFDPDATGRENIYLNGAMMGISHKEMSRHYDSIVEFSELKDKMDLPLKNYSSGMLARLGFSIAVEVQPDIMLIDEILAVGDLSFQQKCSARMDQLKAGGVTFIVVAHSINAIKRLCNKAVYLRDGAIVAEGDVNVVCAQYAADSKR